MKLRGRANAGDPGAAYVVADLLAENGKVEEALALLRGRVDAGDIGLAGLLAKMVTSHSRSERPD